MDPVDQSNKLSSGQTSKIESRREKATIDSPGGASSALAQAMQKSHISGGKSFDSPVSASLFKKPSPLKTPVSGTGMTGIQRLPSTIQSGKSHQSTKSSPPLSPSGSKHIFKTPQPVSLASQGTPPRTSPTQKKKPSVKIASFAKTPTKGDTDSAKVESDDEDELLVYMQFDAQLDSDLLQPETAFKVIGMDTDHPVLQLGNQIYEGAWQDTIGTALFFEEDRNVLPGDPVFTKNPAHMLKYHSKTRKSLHMSRIFIKPKVAENPLSCPSQDIPTPSTSSSTSDTANNSIGVQQ